MFGLDVHGEDPVCLNLFEFLECFVGAAFLGGSELKHLLHLLEVGGVIGFVKPTVLGVDFHLPGAVGLEEGEDVALEGLEFEFAFGEALQEELGFEGVILASFARVVFEDGGGVGLEAMFGAVRCGGRAAFGGFGSGRLLCVVAVCVDLSLCRHSDPTFLI